MSSVGCGKARRALPLLWMPARRDGRVTPPDVHLVGTGEGSTRLAQSVETSPPANDGRNFLGFPERHTYARGQQVTSIEHRASDHRASSRRLRLASPALHTQHAARSHVDGESRLHRDRGWGGRRFFLIVGSLLLFSTERRKKKEQYLHHRRASPMVLSASAAPQGRTGGLFTRMSSVKSRRPDSSSSGTAGERPLSARGSFVDRLRNMQITTSSRPPTGSGTGTSAARQLSGSVGRSAGGSTGSRVSGTRPTASSSVASGASAVRKPASRDGTLGHASGHSTSASAGVVPTGLRTGRATPPPTIAGRAVSGEPTGGAVRSGGSTSPQPRSPGKLPPRDASPVKTHKALASRHSPTGGSEQQRGLKVAITLMTRKPHRFDW